MNSFTAHVTRDGRFWLIHVPEIDRHTQARHLREIDIMARDLVAVMTGEDPAGIQLTIDIHTPDVAAAPWPARQSYARSLAAHKRLRRSSFGRRPEQSRPTSSKTEEST
ncbi:MAG: hypothetical protein ACT4NY_21360 [Pseudonocardiales bacterium]